jgi:hypothetical protein
MPVPRGEIGFVLRISSLGSPFGPWAGRPQGASRRTAILNPQSAIERLGSFLHRPTSYRLPPTAYSLILSFHHNKTLLDAPLWLQKSRIPQKFSPPDGRSPKGGRRATEDGGGLKKKDKKLSKNT